MKIPLEVVFRHMAKKPVIADLVTAEVNKLEKVCSSINRCRVVIEKLARHPQGGLEYSIRVEVTVPPVKEIVVKREPTKKDENKTLETVLREVFDALERQLVEFEERRHPRQLDKRKKNITEDEETDSTE